MVFTINSLAHVEYVAHITIGGAPLTRHIVASSSRQAAAIVKSELPHDGKLLAISHNSAAARGCQ